MEAVRLGYLHSCCSSAAPLVAATRRQAASATALSAHASRAAPAGPERNRLRQAARRHSHSIM